VPLQRASHSPAALGVASDGAVAIIATTSDVRLLDPVTLDEIMTLASPRAEVLQGVTFSPDCTTLAAAANSTVHLWNLQRLHQELAKLGLDRTTDSQRLPPP
jgi:hypothetical protein